MGADGLCTVSAAFNLMNGAQATCFEALFCSRFEVFPVGFAHSLLVFHRRLQKTGPEKGKIATLKNWTKTIRRRVVVI